MGLVSELGQLGRAWWGTGLHTRVLPRGVEAFLLFQGPRQGRLRLRMLVLQLPHTSRSLAHDTRAAFRVYGMFTVVASMQFALYVVRCIVFIVRSREGERTVVASLGPCTSLLLCVRTVADPSLRVRRNTTPRLALAARLSRGLGDQHAKA